MTTPTEALKLDLSKFCANESDPREHLRRPWKHGEWVYATNGHLCVRVPAASMPDVAECDKAPNAQNLFQKHMEQRQCEFLLMPTLPKVHACGDCEGKGTVLAVKCPACTDGAFDHYGDTYDCLHCEGSAAGPGWIESERDSATKRPCNFCDGLGSSLRENGNAPLGESTYSLVYLSWLAELPQVRVCPGLSAELPTKEQVPAVFLFDGGQALLMPRRD